MRESADRPRSPRRHAPHRAGWAALAVGLLLTVASVVLTVRLPDRIALGVMLGLVVLYVAALYAIGIGLLQLRTGSGSAGGQAPTASAWACLITDHKFERVPAREDAPEHWQCRRCGKRRYTRPLSAGETLGGTRVDQLWITRGDTPEDRR